jgi:phosphoenolpyruvate carboxylase
MARYASLATEREHAEPILATILEEHARTHAALARLYGGPLSERRPGMHATVSARSEALALLHERQVRLLARHRAGEPNLVDELLLTVNALAMGLGGTG